MARTVSIGCQDFETIRKEGYFYIDKTGFIQEWWDGGDSVTLINRPRRFGKTLTMSMVEKFFSVEYADRGELFEGLEIWRNEKYRDLQGTYPVIYLSFASIKERDYATARRKICQLITDVYVRNLFLLEGDCLAEVEKDTFRRKTIDMDDVDATLALNQLSNYLFRYYGKRRSSFWTNMTRPCRRLMCMAIGRSLWHLPGVCLTRLLKRTLIWNALS